MKEGVIIGDDSYKRLFKNRQIRKYLSKKEIRVIICIIFLLFLNIEMEVMDLVYTIILQVLNPNWEPEKNSNPLFYNIRLARNIEKYFVWPFCEFFTGVALLYLFYSVGCKFEEQKNKKKLKMSKIKMNEFNQPIERPNYNTKSIIEILEERT